MSRILVIDADPGERLIVRSRMIDLGHEVVTADSGANGLVEARSLSFEVVLIAGELGGGIDSAEVVRRIKAVPQMHALPVIVYCNQSSTPEAADRAFEAGAEVFLPKSAMNTLDHTVQVMLRIKSRQDELAEQTKVLTLANRRMEEQRQRETDMDAAARGDGKLAVRELAAGRPDGVLVVDGRGLVRQVDRGACELLGPRLEGQNLGTIVPASGLEAFVRDARSEAREGFRFDVSARKGRVSRSLMASVVPVGLGDESSDYRILLLLDVGKRRIAEEVLRTQEPGIPRHQLSPLLEAARTMYSPEALGGRTAHGTALRKQVVEASRQRTPVLITGERGVGKEFTARVLHYSSACTGPFLQLRCSALSRESLENELFGYVRGAFPGAVADRPGLLLLAQDGTLHLGEVGDMPLDLQQRLLEVIETGTLKRAGSKRTEQLDVRIIASTSHDLQQLVQSGQFLARLAQKLGMRTIHVPALRERLEDLPSIAKGFVDRFGSRNGIDGISGEAMWVMQQYDWPGNVAELEDCIEQASSRTEGGSLEVSHLTRPLRDLNEELPDRDLIPQARPLDSMQPGVGAGGVRPLGGGHESMELPVAAMHRKLRPWDITDEDPISFDCYEKKVLLRALDSCHGDKLAAARLLNVGKSTLYRKLKRFDIG